ncbi:GntR family transcriptional regulator [Actinomadura sp. WMMA1423]|uniref:GntR family transcriptional regulator n=1 Tax=Actinomadura sp. WMMA1423 TaxID=2591108 RepID=UPI001146E4E4|nr:GntR family transcriptional regulator [Actinomadura sp. WMMA1423]
MGELGLPDLDATSDRPVFKQIADHLRAAIASKELGAGEKLPSESQLIGHYDVARMTVRHALQILQSEGLTVAEHGKGVFVRSRPPVRRLASDRFARHHREQGKAAFIAEAEEAGVKPSVDSIEIKESKPAPEVAAKLNLAGDELVIVRARRYLLSGHPVETATSYIPASIARGSQITQPNSGPGGIYARLEELGHRLDHFTEEIRARMPLRDEARALKLAPGVPVFHLVRTAFDQDGRPVEVCDTVMSSDAYVLSYELPAH